MNLMVSLLMVLGGFFTPAPSPTVHVQESVSGVWDAPLRSAVRYVNGSTSRVHLVIGRCRPGQRCLRVRFGNPGPGLIGSERASTITVRRSWYGYRFNPGSRRNLFIHEIGHDLGAHHAASPSSVMYRNLYYGGTRMRASTFTASERRHLR